MPCSLCKVACNNEWCPHSTHYELICESCGKDCKELHKFYPYDPKKETAWVCDECLEEE